MIINYWLQSQFAFCYFNLNNLTFKMESLKSHLTFLMEFHCAQHKFSQPDGNFLYWFYSSILSINCFNSFRSDPADQRLVPKVHWNSGGGPQKGRWAIADSCAGHFSPAPGHDPTQIVWTGPAEFWSGQWELCCLQSWSNKKLTSIY